MAEEFTQVVGFFILFFSSENQTHVLVWTLEYAKAKAGPHMMAQPTVT